MIYSIFCTNFARGPCCRISFPQPFPLWGCQPPKVPTKAAAPATLDGDTKDLSHDSLRFFRCNLGRGGCFTNTSEDPQKTRLKRSHLCQIRLSLFFSHLGNIRIAMRERRFRYPTGCISSPPKPSTRSSVIPGNP